MTAANRELPVSIAADSAMLEGLLVFPPRANGVVVFSHGSGSGRFSPRNRFVAAELHKLGLASLLLDLLTAAEDRDYERRFDIDLLTRRLGHAVRFVRQHALSHTLPVGLFGASTGAASALRVAAAMPDDIAVAVSRGGRPDLAGIALLERVKAPVLLIVGELDDRVIALNEAARDALMHCRRELVIIPGATHLFEEAGTLEEVARVAGEWFTRHLNLRQPTSFA
jgi:putative phosphoribosyl transferase